MMAFSHWGGETSWETQSVRNQVEEVPESRSISEIKENIDSNTSSITILPEDVLEHVFSFLPVAMIFRLASVCKKWKEVVHSRKISSSSSLSQKPWYFMFTCNEAAAGHAYDPSLRKWYNFQVPCIEKSNWFTSSSCGLVCVMDNDNRSRIYVCNPITRDWKMIQEPPGGKSPDYSALAISLNRRSHCYTIVVTKSKQVPHDFLQWDFSIHVYNSQSGLWETSIEEVLVGWRGGDECVICNGVLYCLIYSTGIVGNTEFRHGIIMYDLSARTSSTSLMRTLMLVPCSLTCGRLMNLKDRLVMVGGIGKHDRPGIIKGIGIWELNKKEWREVARMPHRYFQGFGEFDDVFASSGSDNVIYIQSYGSTALLVFDMTLKQWKWAVKCPVTKKFPLQLFTGFCFEPRIGAAS